MRAAALHAPYTPPSFGDHPGPVPAPGRSLVRVTAAPVVPLDVLCAWSSSYFGPPAVPYVPGVQGVGVAEASEPIAPGTRVCFATSAGMAPGDGSMAERCAVADADSDRLQLRFPLARVDPDVLFVDDGAVLTSAGSGPG